VRFLIHGLLRLLLKVIFGATAGEPVSDRQAIVVANHNTHLDVFVLFLLFPLARVGRVRAVAARDYFRRGLKGATARYLFNAILIDRQGGAAPGSVLEPVMDALRRGDSLIVFPEGTRGDPGVLGRFKSGIGVIAEAFPDVPIYPVCLGGIERTLPRNSRIPVPFSIEIRRLPGVTGGQLVASHGHGARKAIAADLEARIRSGLQDGR
jgi:1-acyl-sn-glycerol-3-phosphate acyltransferase